jgi:hypothetical protein
MKASASLIQFPKADATHPGRGDDAPASESAPRAQLVRAQDVARALVDLIRTGGQLVYATVTRAVASTAVG